MASLVEKIAKFHDMQEFRSHHWSGTFEEYLAEMLNDNFYDQEFIDHSTEKYDYKRGFCTLTAEVKIPVEDLIMESPYTGGWTVSVPTENGTITLN